MFHTLDAFDGAGAFATAAEFLRERAIERIEHQGGFARSRDTGHTHHHAERDCDGDIAQIVFTRAANREPSITELTAARRHRNFDLTREVFAGERCGILHHLTRCSLSDDIAAMDTGARTHVHQVIGFQHGVAIVFDDQHRVAEFLEPFERTEQALIVALMKPDRRLVKNVEHANEARSDLRRQSNTLTLAAGKAARSAVERKVIETHVGEEAQAFANFLENQARDLGLLRA